MKSRIRGTKLTREVEFRRDEFKCAIGESEGGSGRFGCVGRSASVDRYGGICGQSRWCGEGCWRAARSGCRAYGAARWRTVGAVLRERPIDAGVCGIVLDGGGKLLGSVDRDDPADWRNGLHHDGWNSNRR